MKTSMQSLFPDTLQYISSLLSSNSEANASELINNNEDIFSLYYILTLIFSTGLEYLTTHWYVIGSESVIYIYIYMCVCVYILSCYCQDDYSH